MNYQAVARLHQVPYDKINALAPDALIVGVAVDDWSRDEYIVLWDLGRGGFVANALSRDEFDSLEAVSLAPDAMKRFRAAAEDLSPRTAARGRAFRDQVDSRIRTAFRETRKP